MNYRECPKTLAAKIQFDFQYPGGLRADTILQSLKMEDFEIDYVEFNGHNIKALFIWRGLSSS